MKGFFAAALGFGLFPASNAHYIFGRLILDGQLTDTWEYIRQVKPNTAITDDPSLALRAPNLDPDSPDIRCGRGASTSWSTIKTASVAAGDTIGFHTGFVEQDAGNQQSMYHPGFASAWLSRVPDGDLEASKGDGDWYKIFSLVQPSEQSHDWSSPEWAPSKDMFKSLWGTYLLDSANFTIPETTPAGKYLLRFEHIFPNQVDSQFYVGCAHVDIQNSGAEKTPDSTVKIPGVYKRGQTDVYFSTYDLALQHNFDISFFTGPKPDVWTG